MNTYEILEGLCWYDDRNPNFDNTNEDYDGNSVDDCSCDGCHRGTHDLSAILISYRLPQIIDELIKLNAKVFNGWGYSNDAYTVEMINGSYTFPTLYKVYVFILRQVYISFNINDIVQKAQKGRQLSCYIVGTLIREARNSTKRVLAVDLDDAELIDVYETLHMTYYVGSGYPIKY